MFLLIRDVIIFHKFQVKKYDSLYNYTDYHKDSFTEITIFCISWRATFAGFHN